ncbi:MAG: glycerol-3-phosphate 1-O-acyltransferase PlsY [Bacteroidetes bacterium]|nr:glycerol-3-phosphate 1-O-acyltransferase PlsY [Bacteroidota bacterium]
MLNNAFEVVLILAAYLLGSMPFSVWVGKLFYGIDVREFGSGNAGATNTFRVLGKKAGIPVLFMDIAKGILAVALAHFSDFASYSNPLINYQIALGIAAVVGHIFPLFAGFRGGKGVATLLGVVMAVTPIGASVCLLIFLVVFMSFKYISLASMSAGVSFPIVVLTILPHHPPMLIVFSIMVAVLLLITHKKNIQRLLKKQEPKMYLFKTKA